MKILYVISLSLSPPSRYSLALMAATHIHILPNAKTPTSHQKLPLWFSPETGIYTSKFPSLQLPVDPNLDAVSALFSHIHGVDDAASSAFVDSLTGFSISYSELQIMVKSTAAGIYHGLGVRQGDVVSLVLPNSVYFPLIFLSLISLGAIVTTMNPSSSLGEIEKQVSECNVGLAFTSPKNAEKLSSLGIVVIRVPESYDFDSIRIENPKFYSMIKGDFGSVPKPLIKQDDVAAIMYSSGTTGASKGALLTHRNLIATMELFVRFEASQYEYRGSSNVYLAALPLCHIYGLSLFVLGLLSLGSTVVVTRRFDASEVIDVIGRFKITHFPVVPPMLMALTKKAKGVCGQVFQSLKQVSCGAAPLSMEFIEDFLETLPHVDLIQGYGMTESAAVGTRGFNSQKLKKYSSVGLLAPNMQAKVVDWSSGSFLPPGKRGELWIQGPGVMKGYLNNPEATKMTIVEDSWLRTGDIAYFDEDGYLFIVDRMKEIIKAPDEECGEIPVAFVVRSQETTLSEQDVISYVAAQVAPYKKVRKVVMPDTCLCAQEKWFTKQARSRLLLLFLRILLLPKKSAMAALQYLESQKNAHPELGEWYNSLADLYQKKLWHQLTLKLEQFIALSVFQAGDALIQFYHNFITDFETKINPLKLAHFAVVVSRQYTEKEAAVSYLEGVIEKLRATKESRINEPISYIETQIALFKLEQGGQKECKKILDDVKSSLDSMTDIDPSVYANFFWVSSQYHKYRQEFSDFYKNALLYLAYTSVESLSESFKLDLAFDLSLSALLGDNIYNFGELLAHPVLKSLLGTNVEWLYHILQAFNHGDLVQYQELCRVHNASLSAQPALVENEKKLLEKINILCLIEIIFSRPAEDRTIPLTVIAERTKLSIEDVEHLLMKSLSVHLIEGILDQVDGTVHVSWAQPRVLGIPQIKSLRDQLDSWVDKPVRDTREKQIQLWKELILDYCKTQKVFLIGVEEDFPLFSNTSIDRTLSHEARETFLSGIVGEGRAEWLDKGHRKCLILWHRIQDWADIILQFVRENGLEDSVMTVEEIRSGTESHGTELQGIDRTILMRALKLLENKGKLALFKGTSADDEGVKFSTPYELSCYVFLKAFPDALHFCYFTFPRPLLINCSLLQS
ncbi:unnamed protein product [Thlaspi arvense]|uniref:ESCRT-II complex subunit VPS25 n=1 Tax=Thlaspi arvense TaxID=13288 RepID=A0AAU9T6F1_THLAR|nr:unnamed protein product [Thlaspi arvense]